MKTKFDELMQDQEFQKAFAVESLIGDTAELIWQLLARREMTQADLARKLNRTPAYVSQLLNGKANMTVRTLAEVLFALGASVKIEAVDMESSSCEAEDIQDAHTFHIPHTRLESNRTSTFVFGGRQAAGSETPATNERSGYAA